VNLIVNVDVTAVQCVVEGGGAGGGVQFYHPSGLLGTSCCCCGRWCHDRRLHVCPL
jgi:hypothetical protein